MKAFEKEELLDELYELVEKEQETKLTIEEEQRYIKIVDILTENGIEIPFEIEL